MGDFIDRSDLEPFGAIESAKADAMIADTEAQAKLLAPCITADGFTHADALKAILRGAILRWEEAGNGALTQRSQGAGVFNQSETYDTRQVRKGIFWPSEIEQIQSLCQTESAGAYSIDMVPDVGSNHADVCALAFGAGYCSCGASLTRGEYPLYEV